MSQASVHRQTFDWQARNDNGLTEQWDRVVCFSDAYLEGTENPEFDAPLIKQRKRVPYYWRSFEFCLRLILTFRFNVAEPTTCLYRLWANVESSTPPKRTAKRLPCFTIITYYIRKASVTDRKFYTIDNDAVYQTFKLCNPERRKTQYGREFAYKV